MVRRVRGDRAFVRLIKQLPDDVSDAIRAQLNRTGQALLARAQAKAPVYQGKPRKGLTPGALKSGLSYKVPPKRLSLKVGLVGKATNKRLFYGYMVEFGHRIGNTKTGQLKKLEKVSGSPLHARLVRARRRRSIRQSGVPPHPFVYTVSRQEIYAPFRQIWGRTLRRAAGQASDD